MKEHVQKTGVRKYAGDDLIELQSEPLKAIQRFFETYGACIIQGCEVAADGNLYKVAPGMVALAGQDADGKDTFKVVPFAGVENVSLPIYLTLTHTVVERAYADQQVKPIAYNYTATATGVQPTANVPFLEITAAGGRQFVDAIKVTEKLEKTGNGKDVTVTFAEAATRENIGSGEKLSALFGKIRKWFSSMAAVAFSGKAADVSEDAAHRFFTDTERQKLNGIEDNAKNYAHPATHPATMITEDANRRFVTNSEKSDWNSKAPGTHYHSKSQITDFPASLPANGGNADTVDGLHAASPGVVEAGKLATYNTSGYISVQHLLQNSGNSENPLIDQIMVTNGTDAALRKASLTHLKNSLGSMPANGGNADTVDGKHASDFQTAGNYAAATHSHNKSQITDFPASMPASDVSAWAKQPSKPSYTAAEVGAASSGHNHNGVYQPVGNYAAATHNHPATQVTEDTTHRFMTDAEKTKVGYLSNVTHPEDMLGVIFAARVTSQGQIINSWGRYKNGEVKVTRAQKGIYHITHNANTVYCGLANARRNTGFNIATVYGIEKNSCYLAVSNNSDYIDDEFTILLFKLI